MKQDYKFLQNFIVGGLWMFFLVALGSGIYGSAHANTSAFPAAELFGFVFGFIAGIFVFPLCIIFGNGTIILTINVIFLFVLGGTIYVLLQKVLTRHKSNA